MDMRHRHPDKFGQLHTHRQNPCMQSDPRPPETGPPLWGQVRHLPRPVMAQLCDQRRASGDTHLLQLLMRTLFPVWCHGWTKAHFYKCFINTTFAHHSTTLTNWRYQINWSVIHYVGFLTAFLAEWDRASSSWASDWWGNVNEGVSGSQWGPEASMCPFRFQPMSSGSHNALPSLTCRAGKSSGNILTLQVNLYFYFTK